MKNPLKDAAMMNVTLGAYTLHCANRRLAGRRGRGDNMSVRKNIIATLLAWAEVLWTGLTHIDPYLQFSQPKDVGNRPTPGIGGRLKRWTGGLLVAAY